MKPQYRKTSTVVWAAIGLVLAGIAIDWCAEEMWEAAFRQELAQWKAGVRK